MKYSFITQHKKTWPVDIMCRPLGVTRGGYYRHLKKTVDDYHQELIEAVKEIAEASDNIDGSRRMKVSYCQMWCMGLGGLSVRLFHYIFTILELNIVDH